jgi:hypothetical protein
MNAIQELIIAQRELIKALRPYFRYPAKRIVALEKKIARLEKKIIKDEL